MRFWRFLGLIFSYRRMYDGRPDPYWYRQRHVLCILGFRFVWLMVVNAEGRRIPFRTYLRFVRGGYTSRQIINRFTRYRAPEETPHERRQREIDRLKDAMD